MPSFLPVWLLMFKASFRNSKNLSSLSRTLPFKTIVSAVTLKQPHSTIRLTSLFHSVSAVIPRIVSKNHRRETGEEKLILIPLC